MSSGPFPLPFHKLKNLYQNITTLQDKRDRKFKKKIHFQKVYCFPENSFYQSSECCSTLKIGQNMLNRLKLKVWQVWLGGKFTLLPRKENMAKKSYKLFLKYLTSPRKKGSDSFL